MSSVMYRVTAVPNGDQFVVVPASSTAWDAEKKTIGISSIKCPKVSRPGREEEGGLPVPDDPFAWEARELARKATIGKTIKFVKESHIDQLNRDIGEVYYQHDGQPKNLGVELVAAGFANISDRVNKSTPYTKALAGAALEAMEASRGMHGADATEHVRDVKHYCTEAILADLAKKKGTKVQAIVEAVFAGHALKVCLLPSYQMVTMQLTGIVCEKKPTPGQEDTGPNAPSKADKELWDSLHFKEKAFTEKCLLHREVTLILEGTKFDGVLATVVKGSDSFQEELLKMGYAKLFDQTAPNATHRDRLVEAEKKAKEGKVGRWKNLQSVTRVVAGGKAGAEEKAAPKLADEFTGTVLQAASPDTLIVLNDATNEEVRVQLASIRGGGSTDQDSFRPKAEGEAGGKGQASSLSTFARMDKQGDVILYRNLYLEGRAFVCKEVLGKKVTVKPDYMSQIQMGDKTETRLNATVYYDGGKNIATELVRAGLGVPMSGKDRSRDAFLYSDAFDEAKAAKRGLHGGKQGEHKVQDMTKPDEKKGRAMLAYLQRSGVGGAGVPKLKGFIEYVLAPNRYKIYIERENVQISLNLAGIVCPSNNAPFGNEPRKDEPDPCEKEATVFAKRLALQREVEVQVEHFHRGTFVGNVYINGKSAAVTMLEEGLATMTGQNTASMSCKSDATNAEESAKKAQKGIWAPDAGLPKKAQSSLDMMEKRASGRAVFTMGDNKQLPCTVTEVVDSVHFFFHLDENTANMKKVDNILHGALVNDPPAPSDKDVKSGDMVAGRFSKDKKWYRARVTKAPVGGKVDVFYTDYGNRETLPVSEIRKIDAVADSFKTLPPQANEGWLAFMHELGIDEAGAEEAADEFCDFVQSGSITIAHEYTAAKQKCYTIRLGKKPVQNHLIQKGLGLVALSVQDNAQLSKPVSVLLKSEATAKSEKRGMWNIIRGDPRSYDEDY